MSLDSREAPEILSDLQQIFTQCMGWGENRQVWLMSHRDDLVAKLEKPGNKRFQNAAEWLVWQGVKDFPHAAKWFAPCEWIGNGGAVLFMKRTMPAQPSQFPKKIPNYFTDMKRTNFGMLDGRFVCHDYGLLLRFIDAGLTSGMRKADWWGEY